jgi:hypothetical protein
MWLIVNQTSIAEKGEAWSEESSRGFEVIGNHKGKSVLEGFDAELLRLHNA